MSSKKSKDTLKNFIMREKNAMQSCLMFEAFFDRKAKSAFWQLEITDK